MNAVCLAIGVGDAPPLDYLRGAVNGAHAIASWADKQGYRTVLLTDEVNPVELSDVKNALTTLLAGGADRLLLYFAGHGLSSGAANDIWLLSRWDQERKGISIAALKDRLMRYGISQLIVVSDACRTLVDANTYDVSMGADPVLQRGPFAEKFINERDEWYAASPARAAWMIPGPTPAQTRCIFSGLLVEALSGAHPQAFEGATPTGPISNFSLAHFIIDAVPPLAARYGANLKPAVMTGIPPLPYSNNIYVPAGPPPSPPIVPTPWPEPSDAPIAGMGATDGSGRIQPFAGASWSRPAPEPIGASGGGGSFDTRARSFESDGDAPSFIAVLASDKVARATTESAESEFVSDCMLAFLEENHAGPRRYETGSGFALSGALADEALLGPYAKAQPYGRWGCDWGWQIEPTNASFQTLRSLPIFWSFPILWPLSTLWGKGKGLLRQPLPLLVRLYDGRWVGAAALPRFVLNFSVDKVGAEAVIYRSRDMPYGDTEEIVARLRAGALSREQAPDLAQLLRGSKHADPMLGVLAAYLHDSMGDIANVHRTAYFFAQQDQPIPFDVCLLGRLEAHRDSGGLVHVQVPPVSEAEGARSIPSGMRCATPAIKGVLAGAFPWLSQGWARLDPEGQPDLYRPGLAQLITHLLPAPFTTLDATGGELLAHLLFPAS